MNDIFNFLRHVDVNGFDKSKCWEWKGAGKGNGYGHVRRGEKNITAHRYSYQLFVDNDVDGKDVCHKCDNRKCVNPYHLFLGTRKDNMQDAKLKGRTARGFMLPNTKLSKEDEDEIVKRSKAGELYKEIAKDFGVTRHSIGRVAIKNGIRRNVVT